MVNDIDFYRDMLDKCESEEERKIIQRLLDKAYYEDDDINYRECGIYESPYE